MGLAAKSEWSARYQHPLWQKKRLEIMERDGFACRDCDEKNDMLSVHHAYYVKGRDPWEYPNWALETLCKACHGERHEPEHPEEEQTPLREWELVVGFMTDGDPYEITNTLWDLGAEMAMARSRGVDVHKAVGSILHFLRDLQPAAPADV